MMVKRNVPQPPRQIPTADDWRGYETDLDVRDAHRMMFGMTNDQIQSLFHSGSSISRASELLFMPRKAFQYHVFGFAQYLMTDAARGEYDSASPFLHLLVNREKRDPTSVLHIHGALEPDIEFVASRQDYFDASPHIYGNFRDLQQELASLCGR